MEEITLKLYLKFQKNYYKSAWKNLLSIPASIWAWFSISFVFAVIGIILMLCSIQVGAFLTYLFATISMVVLGTCIDRYSIKTSDSDLVAYQSYLHDCLLWLISNGFENKQSVLLLHEKINNSFNELKAEQKERNTHFEKWVQVLAVPVILAIITAAIKEQSDTTSMISYSIAIVIAFMALYCIVSWIKNILWFPNKRKMEQLNCFKNDLRGILDWEYGEFKSKVIGNESHDGVIKNNSKENKDMI